MIKNEPNVVGTAETQLQELQKNFQASYESYGYNFEGVTELLGHPIWRYTETRDLGNDRYIGYRTPFFSPGSPIVTAILLTTFDKVENIYRLKYIAREDVDNYPYKDKILKSLDGKYVQLSKELVIGEFLNFDIKLFAAYYHDLAQLLPSDDREISLRNCNQEVWYVEDCTHTVVGGRETNVECSGHYEFGKTTCSGGGPSPGSSPGSGGPGRPVGGILNNIDRYKFPCAFKVAQRLITEKNQLLQISYKLSLMKVEMWN